MNGTGSFILFCLFLITFIIVYKNLQENKRNRKKIEEERLRLLELERQDFFDFYKTNLKALDSANQIFSQLLPDRVFTAYLRIPSCSGSSI